MIPLFQDRKPRLWAVEAAQGQAQGCECAAFPSRPAAPTGQGPPPALLALGLGPYRVAERAVAPCCCWSAGDWTESLPEFKVSSLQCPWCGQ